MADGHLTASVEDDGMGFDVEAVLAAGPDADGQHQGLVGMRERARLLGGHLVVTSRPGGPTTITLRRLRRTARADLLGPSHKPGLPWPQ